MGSVLSAPSITRIPGGRITRSGPQIGCSDVKSFANFLLLRELPHWRNTGAAPSVLHGITRRLPVQVVSSVGNLQMGKDAREIILIWSVVLDLPTVAP